MSAPKAAGIKLLRPQSDLMCPKLKHLPDVRSYAPFTTGASSSEREGRGR